MDNAIEKKSASDKTRNEQRWKDKKKRKNNRYEGKRGKRQWHEPETEDAKRIRLEAGEERVKRKKSIVLLGYSGIKYSGMQRNPGASTIEEELLKGMLNQKWITDEAFELPQALCFQRAARTDKGVSACRQIVSLKIRKYYY